jgi:hypothetical protein
MPGPVVDLTALPPVVIVRGIASWLGLEDPEQSLDEDFEDFCNRISREPV